MTLPSKTQPLQKISDKKPRYTLIDILRGVSVILMVIYHATWDLVYVYDVKVEWFTSPFGAGLQAYILWSFIIISGFSFSLGRKKLFRGLTVLLASLAVSLVTFFFMPDNMIKHGVLTLLGSAMIILALTDKLLSKIPYYIGIPLSLLLFFFFYDAQIGYAGFGEALRIPLPESLFANELTAYLGFPPEGFHSSDYVPLFPWVFLFIFGYRLFGLFRRFDLMKYLSGIRIPPLEWIGRHALEIYLIHQPAVYGALFILFKYFL